jgi:hypothetical protein
MQSEISFEEWHTDFKAQAAALGLPELGESLAIMAHMEDLSVDEAIEQYKRELGQ